MHLSLAALHSLSIPLRKWPEVPGLVAGADPESLDSDKQPLCTFFRLELEEVRRQQEKTLLSSIFGQVSCL
jgi:hypothetical protein